MRKKRHKFVRLIIGLMLFCLVLAIGLFYFLVANKAPILYGQVLHHQTYKQDLSLDVYFPTQKVYERDPVILYFHGGAWIGGSKEIINGNRFNEAINELRANGYTFVCADYTLARDGKSPFPACIQDAHDAMYWIVNNAKKYQFDLDNVGVMGESAGAQIALMMSLAPAELVDKTATEVHPNYLIDIYGPSNLQGIYEAPTIDSLYKVINQLPESLRSRLDIASTLFGFDPAQDTIKAQTFMDHYSPASYISPKTPPVLMIHGDMDRVVPYNQSKLLKELLDNHLVENKLITLPGVDHAFMGIQPEQKASFQKSLVTFITDHYQQTIK